MTIPKTQLKYIVDRMHVGDSDDKVRAEVRRRVGVHPGWTQKLVAQAEVYALKVHRDNQKMYAYVMGGGVGRKRNPGAICGGSGTEVSLTQREAADRSYVCPDCKRWVKVRPRNLAHGAYATIPRHKAVKKRSR